jgi:hypothetical protein
MLYSPLRVAFVARGLFETMERTMKEPKRYHVYVTVTPTKQNGLTEPYIGRVGPADTIDDALDLIKKDRLAMQDTFGGLIDAPGDSGRKYQIFEATWREI